VPYEPLVPEHRPSPRYRASRQSFRSAVLPEALDKTASRSQLDSFVTELEKSCMRVARLFKFVDRTFNLNIKSSLKIMQFFSTIQPLFRTSGVCISKSCRSSPCSKTGIMQFPHQVRCCSEIGIGSESQSQTLVSRKRDNAHSRP
jgi:hypothetical protein